MEGRFRVLVLLLMGAYYEICSALALPATAPDLSLLPTNISHPAANPVLNLYVLTAGKPLDPNGILRCVAKVTTEGALAGWDSPLPNQEFRYEDPTPGSRVALSVLAVADYTWGQLQSDLTFLVQGFRAAERWREADWVVKEGRKGGGGRDWAFGEFSQGGSGVEGGLGGARKNVTGLDAFQK